MAVGTGGEALQRLGDGQIDCCVVDLRLPYMQIAPMTYVTNHAADRRTLVAHGEAAR